MIKVDKPDEPDGFDEHVRQPGRKWLEARRGRAIRYPRKLWNKWRPCRDSLEEAFERRCGYAACRISSGQVEHFESWKVCDESGRRRLAYEWSNYRWILPQLNGRKTTHAVLDPYEVEDDWFELDIISLNLDLTDRVPIEMRDVAERTMRALGLRRDPLLLKLREEALELYMEGLSMRHLQRISPLVARAIERLLEADPTSLSSGHRRMREHLQRTRTANE